MIGFLWRKTVKNKWLVICLIFGNIILIGITTSVPLFNAATVQRVLQDDLRQYQEARWEYPAVMRLRYDFSRAPDGMGGEFYAQTRDALWPRIPQTIGVPAILEMRKYEMNRWALRPNNPREVPIRARTVALAGIEGYQGHIVLTHGRMPSDHLEGGNVIEALATEAALQGNDMLYGEVMHVAGSGDAGKDIFVRVVGIYDLEPGSHYFWSLADVTFRDTLLVSDIMVQNNFAEDYMRHYNMAATWIYVLDHTAMRAADVPFYEEAVEYFTELINEREVEAWWFSTNLAETSGQHEGRTEQLSLTVWVLQIPIYVMLALFMYMVTDKILALDKNDISVMKSRGAGRFQVLGIYAAQGLLVGAVSFPLGLGLGVALCHVIGASNGFMDFVQRAALDVRITAESLAYGAAALLISFLYMLLPVVRLSGVGIVERKQKRFRNTKKPFWHRYFLDVAAFALSLYVLYNFNSQRELMMEALPDNRAFDPMILASSSLFVIGAGLLCLRLYPYLLRLVFLLFRKRAGPSVFATMLRVIRSVGEEQFVMLFLVFTVSIGIFSAQTARTINVDNAHRIQYLSGADFIMMERWEDNIPTPEELELGAFIGITMPDRIVYYEPDFNRYLQFEEVGSITQVMSSSGTLRRGGATVDGVSIMAVDTRSFGETMWFRDDLLQIHVNNFLNVLSGRPNGVLLSDNFRTDLGFRIGDTVTITEDLRLGASNTGRFDIVGFVGYWPTFNPVERSLMPTGEIRQESQSIAIVNHGHIQVVWGVLPYQVWMRTNGAPHQFAYDFISENNLDIAMIRDTARLLEDMQTDPIVQSMNGILTISFIMIMLLCFCGFLIFWILSIKGRMLQFGVFRAMGMGKRGIMGILVNEQLLLTVSAILIGCLVGEVASGLFVPIIQLSYTAADQVIPLTLVSDPMDYITLFGMLGVITALCLAVLLSYTTRLDISQVLKLGED